MTGGELARLRDTVFEMSSHCDKALKTLKRIGNPKSIPQEVFLESLPKAREDAEHLLKETKKALEQYAVSNWGKTGGIEIARTWIVGQAVHLITLSANDAMPQDTVSLLSLIGASGLDNDRFRARFVVSWLPDLVNRRRDQDNVAQLVQPSLEAFFRAWNTDLEATTDFLFDLFAVLGPQLLKWLGDFKTTLFELLDLAVAIANQIFKLIEDHAKHVGSAVQEFVKEHLEPMIEAIVKIVHDWIGPNPPRPVGTGHEVQEFVIELLKKVSVLDLPGPAGDLLRLLRGAL